MSHEIMSPAATIAQELKFTLKQVEKTIALLDAGDTIPFIARYRKEATEGLDPEQLRKLSTRLQYIREMDERRLVILQSIREQNKLTPELEQSILAASTKNELEDRYLPFRPKRRTKAQIAREAGLEPLALGLWQDPNQDPELSAQAYRNEEAGIIDNATALEGARQILMENFAENADLINELREFLWQNASVQSKVAKGKNTPDSKFTDYFDYSETIKTIPSHRALALFRGRRESALQLALILSDAGTTHCLDRIAAFFNIQDQRRPTDLWLLEIVRQTWVIKLLTKLELELFARLRELADDESINVFSRNLQDLLLAPPAGARVTMGLDPGIRTGVKVAVVNETGQLVDYTTVYPLAPANEWHNSIAELAKLVVRHQVNLISIGNGTGSRDTERLVSDLMKMYPDLTLVRITVSEAGASVYSASELAGEEFPDLDVSLRGAVSIARRLQDPLAELVKIDPKSIGVGQYQHDINQVKLARSLEGVVEDCVNKVGVDVNMASVQLLTHIAGLNETLAKNLVEYRNAHGRFTTREQLKNVPRMGEKTFEQSAGFLRIMNGDNPLDASAVHPEAYPLVEKILSKHRVDLKQVIGNRELLNSINANEFADERYGLPTIRDVLRELDKPGRDPRPEFKTVNFKEGVEDIAQLEEGMILEGIVTNVTNFGAFIDIGVHQDGLVHISAMTNRFISDPHAVVKAGEIVKVKVVEVDKERRRIGLSMRFDEKNQPNAQQRKAPKPQAKTAKKPAIAKKDTPRKPEPAPKKGVFNSAMADAFAKLKGNSR